jgi:hypothetical protein
MASEGSITAVALTDKDVNIIAVCFGHCTAGDLKFDFKAANLDLGVKNA